MKYCRQKEQVEITDEELASFAFRKENFGRTARKYGFVPFAHDKNELTVGDISLIEEFVTSDNIPVLLSCSDYCIYSLSDRFIIEKIRKVRRLSSSSGALNDPELFASASVCAFLLCEAKDIDSVTVCLSCLDTSKGEKESYAAELDRNTLRRMTESLKSRISPFISVFSEQNTVFVSEADRLPFPYRTIREGQVELIQSAFDAMKHKGVLMVSAPTGIGKTISVLYTAVRALGKGLASKIFYFTAKTIGGNSAVDAARRISKCVPHMRTVTICSKEQLCPTGGNGAGKLNRCFSCPLTDSVQAENVILSYRERECAAMADLIEREDKVYTPEVIRECAAAHSVCPHELSLDISQYCGLIICDYNYIIDTGIRLKRYFGGTDSDGDGIFLFDEAHNLPDRIRQTYSSRLSSDDVDSLRNTAALLCPDDKVLMEMISGLSDTMKEITALCTEGEYTDKNGANSYGFYRSDEMYGDFSVKVSNLSRYLTKLIRHGVSDEEAFEKLRQPLAETAFASAYFGKGCRMLTVRENDSVSVELLCLDPSEVLNDIVSLSSSSVFFSATLTPMDYYRDITGLDYAEFLELKSPYPTENLCITAYDSISTRLSDRGTTYRDIAEVIATTVSVKEGKYIAYFPSYEYLMNVFRHFGNLGCKCAVVLQKHNMSMREKQKFIDVFDKSTEGTVVGFCVLGGMFAEGIDFSGDSLIGTIIIGTGIPMISSERNIMSEYYSGRYDAGEGFDYAYTYPGICKIVQAGGRVIRSENDTGVIVLIDDRYRDPKIKKNLPSHWKHMVYADNLLSLSGILREFWDGRKQ